MGVPTETSAAAEGGEWVRLATYGTHPHAKGRQRFTQSSAREMVRYFNSLRGRLARKFGGIPVYIGHPDDPAFARQPGHQDTRAYAWIHALEEREDGLWAMPRWSDAGEEVLNNAFYKYLSPRWAMKPVGNGVFQPVKLLSVGLTNRPNIPGDPIAEIPQRPTANPQHQNQNQPVNHQDKENIMIEKITDKLGLQNEASEEEILQSLESLLEDSRLWNESATPAANEIETLRQEADRSHQLASEAEKALAETEVSLANERTARIEMILDEAIREARIRPSEKANWESELRENFSESLETLANARPLLNTRSCTAELAGNHFGTSGQRRFLEVVNDRMDRTGEDFTTAWSNAKKDRRDLFESLSEPNPDRTR